MRGILLLSLILLLRSVYAQDSTLIIIPKAPETLPATKTQSEIQAIQNLNNAVFNQDQTPNEVRQNAQIQSIKEVTQPTANINPPGALIPNAATTIVIQAPEVVNAIAEGITTTVVDGVVTVSESTVLLITTEQNNASDFSLNVEGPYIFSKKLVPGPTSFEKRVELRALTPLIAWQKQILDNARAVAIVIEKNKLHAVTDSIYQLDVGITLGEQFKLCPGTPFISQPVIGVGTAFVLNEESMMTAAHVFQQNLDRYAIVFGYEMINKAGAFEGLIALKDIYYPTRISQSSEELDLVVFEVSRPLDRSFLKFSTEKKPYIFTPLYMIGHPYGLPKKVALNASVQSNGDTEFFYTSLFAAQGNSGSPVFDLNTNEVIGVLVSGEIDYSWNGNCNAANFCKIPYCTGEKVISLTAVQNIENLVAPITP
ncbi:S1 family peptidase [Dyadobacter chenhuakuii]|uniref:Serine protease n=1 Tax=Dyadobacter chenhuakuii TaxID=2909339 RepID=A0A9X1TTG9_9BACT|nr:serine protease [Dyadobacter chenhuakuii]MCF2498338.1 serine protease [Dyadobacter chenhuakuii]